MMQKLIRPLSILLSLIMILGMFTIIPVTAHVVDDTGEDTPAGSPEDRSELAFTGAEMDLAGTGHYNIAVGTTTVTDGNYKNILGDGTASYDPSKKILTLNNPKITAANGADYGAIHIQQNGVTVVGTYHMTSSVSDYGLFVSDGNSVTLKGDFTFIGRTWGIVSGGPLTIETGSVKAVGQQKNDDGCAIYCDDLTIKDTITRVDMQSVSGAFVGDKITLNNTRITAPADAFYSEIARTILMPNLVDDAKNVTIRPFTGSYYDVWLGARQVDSENCTDIYGDGKASYDPDTKTLTLADPDIVGAHFTPNSFSNNFKILAESDLTVKGSYAMAEDDVTLIPDDDPNDGEDKGLYLRYGIYSSGSLTLDGNFTFRAAGEDSNSYAVVAEGDVTLASGTITASGGEQVAIGSVNGKILVKNGVKVDATSTLNPLIAGTIELEDNELITTPRNGVIATDGKGRNVITDSTGAAASHVVIECTEVDHYNLYVGITEVNSLNCADVFGDGTVSYVHSTRTLTLNEPNITANAVNNGISYKILTSYPLTIKGSYHITEADCDIVFSTTKDMILDGDFTLVSKKYPVSVGSQQYGGGDLTIRGGTLTATSTEFYAGASVQYGEFIVENTATKVDLQSKDYYSIFAKKITIGNKMKITTPSNAALLYFEDLGVYTIGTSSGTAGNRAVIEYNPNADATVYNVWVGSTQVNSLNKDDILDDGGRAKFDPDTNTLTLNSPSITGTTAINSSMTAKILANGSLTIKGGYAMTEAEGTMGVFSGGTVTLDGDFTFMGSSYGIYGQTGVTVSSGSLTAVGGSGGYSGVITNGVFTIGADITKVDLQGSMVPVFAADVSIGGELTITTPEGGAINQPNSTYKSIGYANGTVTDHAVIEKVHEQPPTEAPTEPPTEAPTQEPTETPVGTAAYYVVGNFTDWTVKEAYRMTKNEYAEGEEYCIFGLSLSAEAQFKIVGVVNGEQSWYPEGMGNNYGENGEIAAAGTYAVYFRPNYDGGDDWFYNTIHTAIELPGPPEPPTEEPTEPSGDITEYDLWVGSTCVTSANKDDILGDGKAAFDPATGVLTLSDPVISGEYEGAKICSFTNLTVKGSYHMTSPETDSGIRADGCNLTLSGSFTFMGTDIGIESDQYLTIESGSVKAVAGTDGIGIFSFWEMSIGANAQRVELEGGYRAYLGNDIIVQGGQEVTLPVGGSIEDCEIFEADGYTIAGHAVIEKTDAISLSGRGTESNPYLIYNTEDWEEFARYIADDGDTVGKFFRLMENITVSSSAGTGGKHFCGTFDGDGHTLTLDHMSGAPFTIEGATIKNLKVDGSVSGGRHVSALIGGIGGTAENLIENCVVAATITTSDSYCGGFVGHGGSKAKTTISNCIFTGTINGTTCGTFWGWSDAGSTPVLKNCLDLSGSDHPIGRGAPTGTVTNCYYTKDGKITDGSRAWTNQGKRAYTVTGSEVALTLSGTPGLFYDGKIYAAAGETVRLTAPAKDVLYTASAGTLTQNGSALALAMPAENVTVAPSSDTYYTKYKFISAICGYDKEKADNLFDGKTGTKWCGTTESGVPTVIFRTDTLVIPAGYLLATANDTAGNPSRNPIKWTLEGSTDGDSWTVLTDVSDNRTLEAVNETLYAFSLTSPGTEAYSYFRFTIRELTGGKTFQISELQLVVNDTGEISPSVPEKIYDLWLGSTRVTSDNKDDILGDGKAQFDPISKTLTLDNPTIEGKAPKGVGTVEQYAKIVSHLDNLIVTGSYQMPEDEERLSYGYYGTGSVEFRGNFSFRGAIGVFSRGNVKFTSGSVYIKATGSSSQGINSEGSVIFGNDITKAVIESISYNAIIVHDQINIGDRLVITAPVGASVGEDPINKGYRTVLGADGGYATHVVVEQSVAYNLWLGDTQVTTANKNDILNDGGKAKYDPDTNTLTLDNPQINGIHDYNRFPAKIFALDMDLTVKGSYHMTAPEGGSNSYGIQVLHNALTLAGDFTFMGEYKGVSSTKDLTIASGNLKAHANVYASLEAAWAKVIICADVESVEASSDVYSTVGGEGAELDYHLYVAETNDGKWWFRSAKYVLIKRATFYSLTFDMNGHGTAVEELEVKKDEAAAKPDDPSEEGWTFMGWFTDPECEYRYNFATPVTGDLTLYAKWKQTEYTVTVVADNGTGAQYTEVDKFHLNDEYTLPECIFEAPASKAFSHWDKGNVGDKIAITADTVITAVWRDIFMLGDVDGDGKVDIFDASSIQKSIAGTGGYINYNTLDKNDPRFLVADVDKDGKVDIFDASLIQKYIAGDKTVQDLGIGNMF